MFSLFDIFEKHKCVPEKINKEVFLVLIGIWLNEYHELLSNS